MITPNISLCMQYPGCRAFSKLLVKRHSTPLNPRKESVHLAVRWGMTTGSEITGKPFWIKVKSKIGFLSIFYKQKYASL